LDFQFWGEEPTSQSYERLIARKMQKAPKVLDYVKKFLFFASYKKVR